MHTMLLCEVDCLWGGRCGGVVWRVGCCRDPLLICGCVFCKFPCGEEVCVVELVPPHEATVKVALFCCILLVLCLFRCKL